MQHQTAFVFPGQGSQYAGMGKDVAGKYPAAKKVFDEAKAGYHPIARQGIEAMFAKAAK